MHAPTPHISTLRILELEVTIARKVLPHPQAIRSGLRNLLNKRLSDPALPDEI